MKINNIGGRDFRSLLKTVMQSCIIFSLTFFSISCAQQIDVKNSNVSKTAEPVFNIEGGTYSSIQQIQIQSSTSDSRILYTLNDSIPTASTGITYSGSIVVDQTISITAMAVKSGMLNSDVIRKTYVIVTESTSLPSLSISESGGSFTTWKSLVLTFADSTAYVHYTIDGSEPVLASPTYISGNPIVLEQAGTFRVRAKAFKNGSVVSTEVDETFNLSIGGLTDSRWDAVVSDYESPAAVTVAPDGSILLGGKNGGNSPSSTPRVLKYSSSGIKLWEFSVSAGPTWNLLPSIITDGSNVYLGRSLQECAVSGQSGSGTDWWIQSLRFSDCQETVGNWYNKCFDGGYKYGDNITSMCLDDENNLYVCGFYSSSINSYLWIKKFSAAGVEDLTFEKKTAYPVENALISFDKKNKQIFVAWNSSDNYIHLLKLQKDGTDLYGQQTVSYIFGYTTVEKLFAVDSDSQGNLVISGYYDSGTQGRRWLVRKFSSSLTNISWWTKEFAPYANLYCKSTAIAVDPIDDSVYIGGNMPAIGETQNGTNNKWMIVKLDKDGYSVADWPITGGPSGANGIGSMTCDRSGNLYVFGYSQNLISTSSGQDWWVRKYFR